MIVSSLLLFTLAAAGTLPDESDVFRSTATRPNIALLLDASASMSQSPAVPSACTWWASRYNAGHTDLTKNQAVRAVLTGCRSEDDGLLDRWSGRASISIFEFGAQNNRATRLAPFGASLPQLELGAMSLPSGGNTPMTIGLLAAAEDMQRSLDDSNTPSCRPSYILMLSDGDPNGGGATFDLNCPKRDDPRERRGVSGSAPWEGAAYLSSHRDLLCSVAGEQPIRTFTVGFGAPGSFNPSNLQLIAQHGAGAHLWASDAGGLDLALQQVFGGFTSRRGLFQSAPAVQIDGLFAGNYAYVASFAPEALGRWSGTVKKHCIEPQTRPDGTYDEADRSCMFASASDGRTLRTNPVAVDLWTGTATTSAVIGGAAAVLNARLGAPGNPPAQPARPRRILTWRPGRQGYVSVQPASWLKDDAWRHGLEHDKLLNRLHGYTQDSAPNGDPIAVARSPLADAIHSPTVLLRYGDSCETSGRCFVAAGMNDGMLHFFDAATGDETSALVPGELWKPNNVASNLLKDIDRQPEDGAAHRYYVDGGLVLFHDDQNGDGIIQPAEGAQLIFGLGRGGAAYYAIPISLFNGVPDSTLNPVRPLVRTKDTAFAELRETWASPWAGRARIDGRTGDVAVFPSGHIRRFDDPAAPVPGLAPGFDDIDEAARPKQQGCASIAVHTGAGAHACEYWDGGGYPDPAPIDRTFGPFGTSEGLAYRMRFVGFDLEPGDTLSLLDDQGHTAISYSGVGPADDWTPWVYSPTVSLRLLTNGRATHHRGFHVGQIEYLERTPSQLVEHNPTIYVVDLARWNDATPQGFAAGAADGGLLLRISRRCVGSRAGICVDAATSPDLDEMVCPISAEVSVVGAGGVLEQMVWGDECGQIWRAWTTDPGTGRSWQARRVLALNRTGSLSNQRVSRGESKDFRKIFRKLDLVSSTCPGRRVTGIYFGTGNVQRPGATDELQDRTLNDGRDVVGVVWDRAGTPPNLGVSGLADATALEQIDPRAVAASGKHGWWIALGPNERMLRDPMVFEGVAHFKTFTVDTAAGECSRTTGTERVLAVDNCRARAVADTDGDGAFEVSERSAWASAGDPGGNLLLITPPGGPPLLTHAVLDREERAEVSARRRSKPPRIYGWREVRTR